MKIVRPFDLKDKNGESLMDMETDELGLKDAIYYLDEKTKEMSNDEYLLWLKSKLKNGPFTEWERFNLERDIFSPKFAYLQKRKLELMTACSVVLDYLVMENKLVKR